MARLSAVLLVFLCISGLACALTVGPRIYEQDDHGDISLTEFTYSLSADCNASTISIYVLNESNGPVREANVYIKYIDFSTPLLSSSKTDKDGFTLIRLPGNVKLMRGLFVMVIEKKGFRNKEVHFDLSPCFGQSALPPPPINPPANQASNSTNQSNGHSPAQNTTANQTAPAQPSGNGTPPAENGTGQETGGDVTAPAADFPCHAGALVLALLICGLFLSRRQGLGPS